jgi:hypothetical protein
MSDTKTTRQDGRGFSLLTIGGGVIAPFLLAMLLLYLALRHFALDTGDPTQKKELVWRRLAEPIHLGGLDLNPLLWVAVLILVLAVGKFYVAWMYRRDGQAVGAGWAALLAFLRMTVYYVLAAVFLLPAVQSWEESRMDSRVGLEFDASLSHSQTRDDLPTDDTPPEKLPTRQDKVIGFLTNPQVRFLDRLTARNPVFAYRFGRQTDEDFHVFTDEGHWTRKDWEDHLHPQAQQPTEGVEQPAPPQPTPWTLAEWQDWLKPDPHASIPDDLQDEAARAKFQKKLELAQRLFTGTNVGESVLTLANREANNMLQGLIVFSDGRSTEGSMQAFRDLADRAQKAEIPIFVVAVGEDRPKVKIEITDLRVPEQARPDDHFHVSVEINGEGLADKEVPVALDVIKPSGEKMTTPLRPKAPVKFKPGEPPHAQAEFDIEPATFYGAGKPDDKKKPEFEEGEWKFIARVPREKREAFLKPEHVSDAATMRVVKRPLRVLLFAGGTSHEYQFVRSLMVREVEKRRAELSIYLQPAPGQDERRKGIVQDVSPERFLTQFPFQLEDEATAKAEDKLYNLAAYDVIVGFDPDWTRLSPDQLTKLEQWVGTHGGGLIVLGGPINTLQLARPGANRDKLKPVLDLYPVYLEDARIQELERPTSDPWRLNFPGATPEMEFLKLDEDNEKTSQFAAWEEFFTGNSANTGAPKPLVRGFYNYYPVKAAKEGATTVATFTDPRARLADGKEQPYLVTMNYGSGKVVWLGSGEMRRLRNYKEAYHERFWTKLARYAGAGNVNRVNRRVILIMGRSYTANNYIQVEAQIFGRDLQPLPATAKPKVAFTLPPGVVDKQLSQGIDMGPRSGQLQWNGWFSTRFLVKSPGEYQLDLKVPETGDSEPHKFVVKESNPELDDTRPDLDALYWLASDATKVLARIPDEETQKRVRQSLNLVKPHLDLSTEKASERDDVDKTKDTPRLFFDLRNADLIPECMVTAHREQKNRGAIHDLWDKGPEAPLYWVNLILWVVNSLLALATVGVLAMTLVSLAQGKGAEKAFYLLFTLVLLVALVPLQIILVSLGNSVLFSVVLALVIMLLAIEWLTRKLLRLA